MKKHILSFAILAFCFVWSCRSKEVVPSIPDTVDTLLLKTLAVKGASDVKIDHEKGIIQVTLPESYSSEFIDLDFTLQKSSFLSYASYGEGQKNISNANNPENLTYRFTYEGTRPLSINVQKGSGLSSKDYIIYVNHINGKIKADFDRIDSVSYSLVTDFYLNIKSNTGTTPNKPNTTSPYILLRKIGGLNPDTSLLYYNNINFHGGFNLAKHIPFENALFNIELVMNGEAKVLKESFKFLRKRAVIDGNSSVVANINKKLELKGGIFIGSNKYTIKFSNDFINGNIELNALVKDANTLIIESISLLQLGGYLIDVYENDILFYHGATNISNDGLTSAIRSFIKIDKFPFYLTPPDRISTNKEYFMKGDSLLILPVDMYTMYNRLYTQEELAKIIAPTLQLTKSSNIYLLNPIKKNYSWAAAGVSVVYFQYTIPKSTASGFYEAQLVYPDGRESLKYWNKIEIK